MGLDDCIFRYLKQRIFKVDQDIISSLQSFHKRAAGTIQRCGPRVPLSKLWHWQPKRCCFTCQQRSPRFSKVGSLPLFSQLFSISLPLLSPFLYFFFVRMQELPFGRINNSRHQYQHQGLCNQFPYLNMKYLNIRISVYLNISILFLNHIYLGIFVYFLFPSCCENTDMFVYYHSNQPSTATVTPPIVSSLGAELPASNRKGKCSGNLFSVCITLWYFLFM